MTTVNVSVLGSREEEVVLGDDDRGDGMAVETLQAVESGAMILKQEEHPEFTFVLAAALVPNRFDQQNHTVSPAVIEKAAHEFVEEGMRSGLHHDVMLKQREASIVESYILRKETTLGRRKLPAGTWMLAMRIYDPELRESVKSGELKGFSIGGHGKLRRMSGD